MGNFKFATWTASGKIRKPAIFLGFRNDKDPKTVFREVPIRISSNNNQEVDIKTTTSKVQPLDTKSNWKEIDKIKITSKEYFNIDGNKILLTNVEHQLWKDVSKADLISYYHSVAPYILPYLKDRPQSLHIKSINANAPGFYIKDMEGRQPSWAQIFSIKRKHKKEDRREQIDYLLCQNEATLLYMINLGCVDINPWTSRIAHYTQPDYIVIDLDPSDDDFEKVIVTAKTAHHIFTRLKLNALPKTSGKTGMHLFIPCSGFSFSEARMLAVIISKMISSAIPDIATSENSISERGDKVFVDYNQNDEADTMAAPYCVRPGRTPLISTPLDWKEISKKISNTDFTIDNILSRIKIKGDLFKEVFSRKIISSNNLSLRKLMRS